ncbi:hypothetical protein [Pseudonocardia nigra]|uniref:hypothetical protein n=1 Tax=Pseudonocardia nigra TaxID=1921578 RepID=UPI001C5F7F31|nr:hypothetical protein [Pseudonocardia nigra]
MPGHPQLSGCAPWVPPSLCQMITMASWELRQPVAVLVGVAVPVASAVTLLVVPAESPPG